MFSDPHAVEWVSGILSLIVSLSIVLIVSMAIAYVVIRLWGEEGDELTGQEAVDVEPGHAPVMARRTRIGA